MKLISLLKPGVLMLITTTASYSQSVTSPLDPSPGFTRALSFYNASVGINIPIYSGSEAIKPRYPVSSGFAFFESMDATAADLTYDDITYRNVPTLYDLVTDEVSVLHPKSNSQVALNPDKLSSFTLLGKSFISPDRGIAGNEQLSGNFYRVLHARKTVLLARYSKRLYERIQDGRFVTNYTTLQSEFFVQKDERYYPVKNVAALIGILNDKRQQLLQYNKQYQHEQKAKTKVKETPEQSVVRIVAYYDQISL